MSLGGLQAGLLQAKTKISQKTELIFFSYFIQLEFAKIGNGFGKCKKKNEIPRLRLGMTTYY